MSNRRIFKINVKPIKINVERPLIIGVDAPQVVHIGGFQAPMGHKGLGDVSRVVKDKKKTYIVQDDGYCFLVEEDSKLPFNTYVYKREEYMHDFDYWEGKAGTPNMHCLLLHMYEESRAHYYYEQNYFYWEADWMKDPYQKMSQLDAAYFIYLVKVRAMHELGRVRRAFFRRFSGMERLYQLHEVNSESFPPGWNAKDFLAKYPPPDRIA